MIVMYLTPGQHKLDLQMQLCNYKSIGRVIKWDVLRELNTQNRGNLTIKVWWVPWIEIPLVEREGFWLLLSKIASFLK